jgi:hypothetical protein
LENAEENELMPPETLKVSLAKIRSDNLPDLKKLGLVIEYELNPIPS